MNIIRDIADCVDLRVALANSQSGTIFNNQVLQDMKTVIKIWRWVRLPKAKEKNEFSEIVPPRCPTKYRLCRQSRIGDVRSTPWSFRCSNSGS